MLVGVVAPRGTASRLPIDGAPTATTRRMEDPARTLTRGTRDVRNTLA